MSQGVKNQTKDKPVAINPTIIDMNAVANSRFSGLFINLSLTTNTNILAATIIVPELISIPWAYSPGYVIVE